MGGGEEGGWMGEREEVSIAVNVWFFDLSEFLQLVVRSFPPLYEYKIK